jgi:hypothetical protein
VKPPLEIKLFFSNRVDETHTCSITGDNEEAWIRIQYEGDDDWKERSIMLDPHEIDVFISALTLFKYRILNPKRGEEDEC